MKLNTPHENLWNAAKEALREKFTALTPYNDKEVRCQINDLSFYSNEIKRQTNKQKLTVKWKKIKVREKISEIESYIFEKIKLIKF